MVKIRGTVGKTFLQYTGRAYRGCGMNRYLTDTEDIEKEVEREEKRDSAAAFLEKQRRIKKEINRLRKLFKDIDENKKKLVFTTIDDVAFMTITMQDLRESIVRDGTKCTYKNGENQYGVKQSPDAQLYLQLSQKNTQAMKILVDCLPKTEKIKAQIPDDDFDDFVSGREDL